MLKDSFRRKKRTYVRTYVCMYFFLQILALLTVIPFWVCNLQKVLNLWLFLRKKWYDEDGWLLCGIPIRTKFLNLINFFINGLIYLTGSWDSFLNGNTCMSVVSMATRLLISIVIFFLHMHVCWWLQVVYIDMFFRCSQLSSWYIPHCILWQ